MAKLDTYISSNNIATGGTVVSTGLSDIDIALGNVSGLTFLVVAGRNPDIDTGTVPEDVWLGGGAYGGFDVAAAEALDVVSSSASDTAAGTGAQSISIEGLDASFNEISEVVVMNGLTTVTTTATFLRVNSVSVNTVGTDGVNQGQITVSQTTSTTVMAVVGSLVGNQQQALYTVPANKTLYLKNISATLNDANGTHADFFIQVRPENGSWQTSVPFGISQTGGQISADVSYPSIPAKTDIRVRVDATSSNNTDITAILNFLVSEL